MIAAIGHALGRVVTVAGLVLWTIGEIVSASLQVARDIVAPSARVAPAVLIVPLHSRTNVETATVFGIITLTPGTLTVTIREDPRALWVHGMYGADPEALRAELNATQSRVLRALRWPEPVEEIR